MMENTQQRAMELIYLYNSSECFKIVVDQLNQSLLSLPDYQLSSNYSEWAMDMCIRRKSNIEGKNQPYILPWYEQLTWITIFGAMILTAIIGNIIVIWIIVAHRQMRTITNLFLLNLAIADFLLASGNAFFNFIFILNSHWPFGTTFCIINNFMACLTVSCSVFTILAMSVDRFLAIVCPFRHRKSPFTTYVIIILVWLLGAALSLPALIFSTTVSFQYENQEERTICYLVWPDGTTGYSYSDYLYNVIFLVLTYVFPMAFMAVTYTWTGFVLWRSNAIGERTEVQLEAVKAKQRVVRMQVAVALLFGICWLPYHLYFLCVYQYPEVQRSAYIQEIFLGIYWLAMSHSMHNPIVYYWMNAKFRRYFRSVLCLCKGRSERPNYFTTPPLTVSDSTRTRSSRNMLPSSTTIYQKNYQTCSRMCPKHPENNCYEL